MMKIFLVCLLAASVAAQTCAIGSTMTESSTELTGNSLRFSFTKALASTEFNYLYMDETTDTVIGEDTYFYLTIGIRGFACSLQTFNAFPQLSYIWNGTNNWDGESDQMGPFLMTDGTGGSGWCLINFGGKIASISFRSNSDVAPMQGKATFLTQDKTEVGCKTLTSKTGFDKINQYTVHSFTFNGVTDQPYYMNVTNGFWTMDSIRIIMSGGVTNEPVAEPVSPPVKKTSAAPSLAAWSLASAVGIAAVAALVTVQ